MRSLALLLVDSIILYFRQPCNFIGVSAHPLDAIKMRQQVHCERLQNAVRIVKTRYVFDFEDDHCSFTRSGAMDATEASFQRFSRRS